VPLGWNGAMDMIKDANPVDNAEFPGMPAKQTVELRSPDGSADLYKLFAGLVVAIEHGLGMPDALRRAEDLYVDYNIFSSDGKARRKKLESLPASCWESAECLLAQRDVFEKDGVFPSGVIDNVVIRLKAFNDKGLSEKLFNKQEEIGALVKQFLHCS
jgi:glutamine synthetase